MPDSDDLILTQEGIPPDTHINIGRVKDKIWELHNNKSSLVPKIDDCPVCRGSR
ncbi:hypothetical protein QBC43DRAFT_293857 [Cladorrhinum sp. PSN259]|nr:hypothetical protein QBC43DRAFT_293857 [Cladorrhinum sp. PSN259]